MDLNEIESRIGELKTQIDALRPINAETEQKIMQKFRLDWNYHSNNLEGNSLTFGETKSFLLHGITAEGKPLKDHLDIKGHNEAILLLDDVIKANRPLTETFLRELHEIILHEPYDRPAVTPDGKATTKRIEIGQYKRSPNHVKTATGEIFYFASPEETPAKMNDLMDWFVNETSKEIEHPLIIAAEFHYRFIRIHPFDDGNGRMARILMNLILMKFGFPPVIIKTNEKAEYFRALQMADGGDLDSFTGYVGEQLVLSLNLFIKGAKGENIEDIDDVDKQIALLKAKLQEERHKIIYSLLTKDIILEDSLYPLFNAIFQKNAQFNEFFNQVVVTYSTKYRKDNGYTRSWGPTLKSFFENIKTNSKDTLIDGIVVRYNMKEFLKTEEILFDINIEWQVLFNRYDYTIKLNLGGEQVFKNFYHNRNDEKFVQKIANTIAKYILQIIEDKLAE